MKANPPQKTSIRDIVVGTLIVAVMITVAVLVAISVYHHEILRQI